MQDRVAQYPNRFKLNPVDGQENVVDLERMDGATQNGTPLNKSTLLSDETARMFNLEENSPSVTPDIVFRELGRRTSWKKVVEYESKTEEKTLTIPVPSSLKNNSELMILFFAGYSVGGTSSDISVYFVTSNQRKIMVTQKDIAQVSPTGGKKNFQKIGIVDIVPVGNGELSLAVGNLQQEDGNLLYNGETISSVVVTENVSNYKLYSNATIMIFAR